MSGFGTLDLTDCYLNRANLLPEDTFGRVAANRAPQAPPDSEGMSRAQKSESLSNSRNGLACLISQYHNGLAYSVNNVLG